MNRWFPALDRTAWINEHIDTSDTASFATTKENCMFLLVTALGSLAEDQSIGAAQSEESKVCILGAQIMMPAVILGGDIISVQCLILFGIYYAWQIQPPQSYNFVCMASLKLQFILFGYLPFQSDSK